jgi:cell division septation protein DedD
VPEATTPQAEAAGRFAIQVASLRDPAGAADEWRRLVRLHPSLAGLEPQPAKVAEIPGKGRFYRVLGGAFASRAEAEAACARLLAEGSYCRPVPL